MKKSNLIILLALYLTTSNIIFFACTKDTNEIIKTPKQIEDKQLEDKILKFRNRIDAVRTNPELKLGIDPLTIDSAIWYLEATANLTYGDASSTLYDYVIDSSFIFISVNNGFVNWINLQTAYDQIIDSLSDQYNSINSETKQLVVADLEIEQVSGTQTTIKLISGFQTASAPISGNEYSWYWGWNLGRCDGSGLGQPNDASDIIERLANNSIPTRSGDSYYTDVETYWMYPCEFGNENGCMTFEDFQYGDLYHKCMSPEEILLYSNNIKSLGTVLKPSNKSLISYTVWDDTAFGIYLGEDSWYMGHFVIFKYAIWHTGTKPPTEL